MDATSKNYVKDISNIVRSAQSDLIYNSGSAIYITYYVKYPKKNGVTRQKLIKIYKGIQEIIRKKSPLRGGYFPPRYSVLLGIGFNLLSKMCKFEHIPLPESYMNDIKEYNDIFVNEKPEVKCEDFKLKFLCNGPLSENKGDIWLYIKHLNGEKNIEEYAEIISNIDGIMFPYIVQFENSKRSTALTKDDVLDYLKKSYINFSADPVNPVFRIGSSRNDYTDPRVGGKILGCRFPENLNTVTDITSFSSATLVGVEDPLYKGSTFAFTQSFVLDWEQLLSLSEERLEDIIGRKTNDEIIPGNDTTSHVRSSRILDDNGDSIQLLRLSLPTDLYNCRKKDDGSYIIETDNNSNSRKAFIEMGKMLRDEYGIYFVGMSKSLKNICSILKNQIGRGISGNYRFRDQLISTLSSEYGSFYFIPNCHFLTVEDTNEFIKTIDFDEANAYDLTLNEKLLEKPYQKPADKIISNPYLFYNHKDYLDRMSHYRVLIESEMVYEESEVSNTYETDDKLRFNFPKYDSELKNKSKNVFNLTIAKLVDPPTFRILTLLRRVFRRWQDGWYFDRSNQKEIGHLKYAMYRTNVFEKLIKVVNDAGLCDVEDFIKIYKDNVPIFHRIYIEGRDKWEINLTDDEERRINDAYEDFSKKVHLTLRSSLSMATTILLTAHEDYAQIGELYDSRGNKVYGPDTLYIHPLDIIIGGMPNLSLGSGKILCNYLNEYETRDGFLRGLSYASATGHNVPDFSLILENGTEGVSSLIKERLKKIERKKSEGKGNITLLNAQEINLKGSLLVLTSIKFLYQSYYEYLLKMIRKYQKSIDAYKNKFEKVEIEKTPYDAEMKNMKINLERLDRLRKGEKPKCLVDALQLIFTLHSCLHHIGEPTAVGRLDKYLYPFYRKDLESIEEKDIADYKIFVQEAIDSFWIKLGEKAQLNRQYFKDEQPYGNMAFGNSSGPYPQGSQLNQWIQQVTIGGIDLCNKDKEDFECIQELNVMCLRASRRLPLNAPCLSLRICDKTPEFVLAEATKTLLSGGAHPLLFDDRRIVKGLKMSGKNVGGPDFIDFMKKRYESGSKNKYGYETPWEKWDSEVPDDVAMDWACDGCYEPQLVGQNWFMLGGFPALLALEEALNRGMQYGEAGPIFINGKKTSFDSKHCSKIKSFQELEDLFLKHFEWDYEKQIQSIFLTQGDLSDICPSPFLNIFMKGCWDTGLDMYNGGPYYHMFAPMFTGLVNVIDSLFAIKKLVFDKDTCITDLQTLVLALKTNWGENIIEPFFSQRAGEGRNVDLAQRLRILRNKAIFVSKFGHEDHEVNQYGFDLMTKMANKITGIFTNPSPMTREKMADMVIRLVSKKHKKFSIIITPGVGCFEGYKTFGLGCGASADGRKSGDYLSGDFTPSPTHEDKEYPQQTLSLIDVLDKYSHFNYLKVDPKADSNDDSKVYSKADSNDDSNGKKGENKDAIKEYLSNRDSDIYMTTGWNAFWDSTPSDLRIPEDMTSDCLFKAIKKFQEGYGPSMVTITCADSETFDLAYNFAERYDLLRVRTGGWSEFFIAMYYMNQTHHPHRMIYGKVTKCPFSGTNESYTQRKMFQSPENEYMKSYLPKIN